MNKDKQRTTPVVVIVAVILLFILIGLLVLFVTANKKDKNSKPSSAENISDKYIEYAYKDFDVDKVMNMIAHSEDKEEKLKADLETTYKSVKETINSTGMEISFSQVENIKLDEGEVKDIKKSYSGDMKFSDLGELTEVWLVKYKMTIDIEKSNYHEESLLAVYVGKYKGEIKVLFEKPILQD